MRGYRDYNITSSCDDLSFRLLETQSGGDCGIGGDDLVITDYSRHETRFLEENAPAWAKAHATGTFVGHVNQWILPPCHRAVGATMCRKAFPRSALRNHMEPLVEVQALSFLPRLEEIPLFPVPEHPPQPN